MCATASGQPIMTMLPSHVEIGDNEFVEAIGIEYDQLVPGLRIEHRPGFRCDLKFARERGILAGDHSCPPLNPDGDDPAIPEVWLVSMLTAATTRAFGRVAANLAWENVEFATPVRDGEMVFAESLVVDRRASRSRPGHGILHVATSGCAADGREVCRFERKLLLYLSVGIPHLEAGYV